ncbi:cytochrome c3 family protein [Flavobacteriaceae bacterium]|nr:cytochrome c3 family protein [Flavobacteriaceae bacterium]
MPLINPLRKRQFYGLLAGLVIGIACIATLITTKTGEEYLSMGPMNTGHQGISCNTCHSDAKGKLLQQIQSNAECAIGLRKNMVAFGSVSVNTKKCLSCHERDNDRHPTHRFKESKYRKSVKEIDARECNTCHSEHQGIRVTLANGNYCMSCHSKLKVKKDPLDVPHSTLIKNGDWSTCLQCHDFHGNHQAKAPEKLKDTIPLKTILNYFKGGKDPYAGKKKFKALSQEQWFKKYANK